MEGLVDLTKRSTLASDKKISKKAKALTSPTKSIRGTKTLAAKIESMRDAVEQYLGSKRSEYKLIDNEGDLMEYVANAQMNGYVAIDTETTSLDPMTCDLVGFSLYIPNTCVLTPQLKPCYVPVNHKNYITGEKIEGQVSIEDVRFALQEMIDAGVKFIFFNAKFDIRVIRHTVGVYITPYFDAYIAARLLNENEGDNGLKPLHKKYVLNNQEDAFSFGQLFEKIPFDLVPIPTAYLYGARDALVTYELYDFQLPYLTVDSDECKEQELEGVANVFWNIEIPLITIVADIEDVGVRFDYSVQKVLSEKYNAEKDKAEQAYYSELCKYTNTRYSISSPKQLVTLFYDDLKLLKPVFDKKKDKMVTPVDAETLESCNHPLAKLILEYRACAKLISTYIDKMALIAQRDGRVHCSFNQCGTDTGRFSSSNPNMQNIPSHNEDIRKMFQASEGYIMIGADFSAQEPRMTAHMSNDERMIQAYKDGKDLYCEIASIAFKVPYEDCLETHPDGSKYKEGKERRGKAKAIVLGICYGKGIPAIAEDLHITKQEAQEIYDKVLFEFPGLKQFMKDSEEMAYEKGYVTTLFGRKRRLPDIQLPKYEFSIRGNTNQRLTENAERNLTRKLDGMWFDKRKDYIAELAKNDGIIVRDNGFFIARAERQCVNARIQGSAGEQIKTAMIKIATDPELKSYGFRILLQIHDELIGECPIATAKAAGIRFKYLMEHALDGVLKVPSICDVTFSYCWYGDEIELK